jgi:hypothetical protein
MSDEGFAGRLAWAGTVALGVWLSMWTARCVTATAMRWVNSEPGREPVRELVKEVLSEHEAEDRPIVHAFEEALEAEALEAGEEETAARAP